MLNALAPRHVQVHCQHGHGTASNVNDATRHGSVLIMAPGRIRQRPGPPDQEMGHPTHGSQSSGTRQTVPRAQMTWANPDRISVAGDLVNGQQIASMTRGIRFQCVALLVACRLRKH